MKTVRKWLAFLLAAGLMVSAMAVFADDENLVTSVDENTEGSSSTTTSPSYSGTKEWTGDHYEFRGDEDPSSSFLGLCPGDMWYQGSKLYIWAGGSGSGNGYWVLQSDDSGSDSKSALEKEAEEKAEAEAAVERALMQQASRDAVRLAGAAMDEGFASVGDMYIANQKSMSAGEFYNNAIVSTPGIENAVTVGQGGGLIVNGQVTNMSATITKVTNRAYVDSVRVVQEGRVLNVVDVSYPAVEATITFYMPSVTAEDAIVALQYNAGRWVEVEVAEVRADHVTLNMKGNGVVAFIAR